MPVLIREKALQAYAAPDQGAALLRVVTPSLRRLFYALVGVFVLAAVASVLVRVNITTQGRGIVRPRGGVLMVRAPVTGYVQSVEVAAGQEVAAGATLALMGVPVVTRARGIVDAISVHRDEYVLAGAPLLRILPLGEELVGFVALPARDRPHLSPGQEVRLAFDGLPSTEVGFGRAVIRRMGGDVLSPDMARPFLAEETSCAPGPCMLVELAIESLPPYAESELASGMPFEALVTVRRQRVVTLLIRPLMTLFAD